MRYRIYRDETRLEPRGVQAIVQKNDRTGWHVESHGDYYILKEDDRWQASDMSGLLRECRQRNLIRPTIGTTHEVFVEDTGWVQVNDIGFHMWLETQDWILVGETLTTARFQEIFQDALADADFGRKHGYLSGEVKP